ncbi:sulfatase-like hydrolase/transferase [Botrimarina hoheduenensis]|uniref:Arylsulfatase n=1 Tax=Botrimarina hoheduenensis TaxID=2528000 RepID=A0A5C5VPW3_9BACT|nr:sulfatase-like hydrolase/transferase [Botrimarina hoheduenensis]TWT40646.1 Arylsulfatase [Botrimarina hoheduenensis]
MVIRSVLPLLGFVWLANVAPAETSRPNLVFVLTDDHRRDFLGCYGNTAIETPHLDALAADGVLFENASVTSAICTPSRASYFLGQYERRHGVNFNSGTAMSMRAWAGSFPVLLREAGYFTGYVGKNHVAIGAHGYDTGLIEQSFDYWYGAHGHLHFYPKETHDVFRAAQSDTQVEVLTEGASVFLDRDADYLEGTAAFVDQRPEDQPFLLMVAFNLPHGASTSRMELRPEDDALYRTAYRDRLDTLPIPSTYVERAEIDEPKLPPDVAHVEFRQHGYDWVDQEASLRERVVRHYQTVTGIDRFLGRLRDVLREQGVADNTVIVFASDHGLLFGEHGLGGKALNYEPCLAIPMIVHDPRQPAERRGRREPALVQSIDVAPTLLDLADVTPPESMQGSSLQPLLEGDPSGWRTHAFSENLWSTYFGNPRCESVRGQRWKYIRYFANDRELYKDFDLSTVYLNNELNATNYRRWLTSSLRGESPDYEELFDLEADPDETTNLTSAPEHADVLDAMRRRCLAMAREAKGDLDAPPATVPLQFGSAGK